MGGGEKIEGLRVGDEPDFNVVDGKKFYLSQARCVLLGVSMTGVGVQAISYTPSHLECQLFQRVDVLLQEETWCSVGPVHPEIRCEGPRR